MSRLPTLALFLLTSLALGCSEGGNPVQEPEPPVPPDPPTVPAEPPVYRVSPPAGKLPWPQHNPAWAQEQYDAMLAGVWVVNNYGLYQGGTDRSSLYLHDGLDVALPNGTPIYAVESGTVRANVGGNEFYRSLVVEDDDEPGYAWGYTHVYNFRVQPGQKVHRGTLLAFVNFQGLEHIHLDRLRLRPGGSWETWGDMDHLQPDTFFVYRDVEPPAFEGRLRYVRNETDSAFLAAGADGIVTVSGDVDVVAGLRDPGEWARSKVPFGGQDTYGDRNAPNRVEYEVAAPGGAVLLRATTFDLSRLVLPREPQNGGRVMQVLTLYKHYESVRPEGPPVGNYNRKFNFYVVTNTAGSARAGGLDPADRDHAWRTAERGADGRPRFPNGDYVVTVRAYDFKGNVASQSETVRVRN